MFLPSIPWSYEQEGEQASEIIWTGLQRCEKEKEQGEKIMGIMPIIHKKMS